MILRSCLKDLPNWVSTNVLHLNEWKTEIGVFGPACFKRKLS